MDLVLNGLVRTVIADFKTSSKSAEPLEISHEIQLISLHLSIPACLAVAGGRAGDPLAHQDQGAQD
jgi:hypothetical protein